MVHLFLRPTPVVGREGIERKRGDPEIWGGFRGAPDRSRSGDMAGPHPEDYEQGQRDEHDPEHGDPVEFADGEMHDGRDGAEQAVISVAIPRAMLRPLMRLPTLSLHS